jgi:hypothetical protein
MKFRQIIFLYVFLMCQMSFGGNPISDRPEDIQRRISEVHRELVNKSAMDAWTHSGKKSYYIMNIVDQRIVDWLMQNKAKDSKETIRLLDFGSGDFSWPLTIARYIKENRKNKNIKFEIVGVTGEISIGPKKIEEYQREFAQEGITLTLLEKIEIESIDKILKPGFDLIVSSWTLRHLVDPLGTIWRLYNLLNPNGLLLAEGFYLYLEGDGPVVKLT